MKALTIILACILGIATSTGPASAGTGLFFTTEGLFGYTLGDPLVPFVAQPREQYAPGNRVNDWLAPDLAVQASISGRLEFGINVGVGANSSLRLGTLFSGWAAIRSVSVPTAFGFVFCQPSAGKPQCEIGICYVTPVPCGSFETSLTRRYWEVAPEILVGWQGEASRFWIGVQPFVGAFFETGAFQYFSVGNADRWLKFSDSASGHVIGGLVVTQAEFRLSNRVDLLLSAGAGAYRATANSLNVAQMPDLGTIDQTDFIVSEYPSSLMVMGFRGQLGVGVNVNVNSRLSVGVVGRADFWSAFPGVTWPQSEIPQCVFKPNGDPVCEPPRVNGQFGLIAGQLFQLTGGLRITLRTGQ